MTDATTNVSSSEVTLHKQSLSAASPFKLLSIVTGDSCQVGFNQPAASAKDAQQALREDAQQSHETAAHTGVTATAVTDAASGAPESRLPQHAASATDEARFAANEGAARPVRRGLPRVPGGEPWPTAEMVAAIAASSAEARLPENAGSDDDARRVAASEPGTRPG